MARYGNFVLSSILGLTLGMAAGAASAEGIAGAPAPFDKGNVSVALITYISVGDFQQAYVAGAQKQAKALGINLRIFQGRQNADEEREQIEQAINLGVKAIVINNGVPESLKDVVKKATDAGIKVSAFDVNLDNPAVTQIEQSDHEIARLPLEQAVKDNGDKFNTGVIYVAGFAPLDRRVGAYHDFLKLHPGIAEKAQWGVVDSTVTRSVADQTKAILRSHPDINVVFAPWDEFAKGVKLGIDESNLTGKVKVYGVDISTPDIQLIREPNSAWVATAATNPAVVGAVSVRAAALKIAGQEPPHNIQILPTLVTRDDLIKNDIKTFEDLGKKFPLFLESDAAQASWIPKPSL